MLARETHLLHAKCGTAASGSPKNATPSSPSRKDAPTNSKTLAESPRVAEVPSGAAVGVALDECAVFIRAPRRDSWRCAMTGLMPVSTAEKITAVSEEFQSQRRLAELLGVSPAQVTRWRRGQGIDEVNARRVDVLELAMSSLLRLYSSEAAELWLKGMNPHLGGRRPLDVIRAGHARELLDAIAQERAGSYA
jgi:uncharacterized protein (DUF2384 family)